MKYVSDIGKADIDVLVEEAYNKDGILLNLYNLEKYKRHAAQKASWEKQTVRIDADTIIRNFENELRCNKVAYRR